MKSLVFVVAVLALAVVDTVQAQCERGCSVPVTHYKEIGCEPVFEGPEYCCPSYYNCNEFERREADKCYVTGNVFNTGEKIDRSLTEANCLASCVCSNNEEKDITCAHIDCPENLNSDLEPGCYRAYELDSCCSTKTVCPPFNDVAECDVGGRIYYEGQIWEPEKKGLKCVCKPNFRGILEAPFCAEVKCGTELLHTKDIRKNCAPVYLCEPDMVCPIKWACPQEGEVVIPNRQGTTSEQQCSYGMTMLNIGDKLHLRLSEGSPKIYCKCKIPPLVTCKQRSVLK